MDQNILYYFKTAVHSKCESEQYSLLSKGNPSHSLRLQTVHGQHPVPRVIQPEHLLAATPSAVHDHVHSHLRLEHRPYHHLQSRVLQQRLSVHDVLLGEYAQVGLTLGGFQT